MGPLFGAVVARALDAEWQRVGRPDPYLVAEAGAGRGALAEAVLRARPVCAPALRYLCVERSAVLREEAELRLGAEPAAMVLGPVVADDDGEHRGLPGMGPLVAVVEEVPVGAGVHVVLANELLDNLPFRLLERSGGGWSEVLVGTAAGGGLAEILVDAPAGAAAEAERLAAGASTGARIPLQRAGAEWLRRALGAVSVGRVVVLDYAASTPALAERPWRQWVRTYRAHAPGRSPLDDPGHQDVTCEVAVDQLAAAVRPPDADRPQADWLRHHGLDELVATARATWHQRAALGDLAAMAARSRVGEAAALCDPAGLGAFRVLEWEVHR